MNFIRQLFLSLVFFVEFAWGSTYSIVQSTAALPREKGAEKCGEYLDKIGTLAVNKLTDLCSISKAMPDETFDFSLNLNSTVPFTSYDTECVGHLYRYIEGNSKLRDCNISKFEHPECLDRGKELFPRGKGVFQLNSSKETIRICINKTVNPKFLTPDPNWKPADGGKPKNIVHYATIRNDASRLSRRV